MVAAASGKMPFNFFPSRFVEPLAQHTVKHRENVAPIQGRVATCSSGRYGDGSATIDWVYLRLLCYSEVRREL